MTLELQNKIASHLNAIYRLLGDHEQSKIDRRIAGQFRMLDCEVPKHIVLDDGNELIGRPLFIATHQENLNEYIRRDGEIFSKHKETWLVLFVTEARTWLLLETLDYLYPISPNNSTKAIRENGQWVCATSEQAKDLVKPWVVMY